MIATVKTKSLKVTPEQMKLIHERDEIIVKRCRAETLKEIDALNPRLQEINRLLGI